LQRTIPGVFPQAGEQVRNISNKVAVEKEVLNKDKDSEADLGFPETPWRLDLLQKSTPALRQKI